MYYVHGRLIPSLLQAYADTTDWNFMEKKIEDGSLTNLDPVKF